MSCVCVSALLHMVLPPTVMLLHLLILFPVLTHFQAVEAYNAGKEALNNYITIANDGLMLELNKIEPI